ncbi:SDR family oxidoreductase [Curtobacterium sp. 9128]|uniref:SDR family oxidoreductase n=1 Tax=Curtobacterium sp. 9128 TaxID=1793722 RepID=UPI0011AA1624|nr:SDR family oxidoreductase [Curtobacterium sp. 9128]
MTERLDGRIALVTGANRGIGERFVREALERGAAKVYATARSPRQWDDARIVPLVLDLTDARSIAAAAEAAPDVDLLVNNAAIAPAEDTSIADADDDLLRSVFATNVFGTMKVSGAFAPVLARNGGGAVLTVLSLAAWIPIPTVYAASKAAAWGATNGLRTELAAQGTTVTGVFVGMVDTDMGARFDVPKTSPESVVAQAYDGVVAGVAEVLADDDTRMVKGLLSHPAEELSAVVAPALAAITG